MKPKPIGTLELIEALHRALELAKGDVEYSRKFRYGDQSNVVKALKLYERWVVQSGRDTVQTKKLPRARSS